MRAVSLMKATRTRRRGTSAASRELAACGGGGAGDDAPFARVDSKDMDKNLERGATEKVSLAGKKYPHPTFDSKTSLSVAFWRAPLSEAAQAC